MMHGDACSTLTVATKRCFLFCLLPVANSLDEKVTTNVGQVEVAGVQFPLWIMDAMHHNACICSREYVHVVM